MQACCLDRSHVLRDNCEIYGISLERAWLLKLLLVLDTACVPLRFSDEVLCDLEGPKFSATVFVSVGLWTQIISLVRHSAERQSKSSPFAILSDCPPSLFHLLLTVQIIAFILFYSFSSKFFSGLPTMNRTFFYFIETMNRNFCFYDKCLCSCSLIM